MDELIDELKVKVVAHLNLQDITPENINPDDSLFNSGLGLDSIDVLELIVLLQQDYGIKVGSAEEGKQVFQSIRTMAEFIKSKTE
ncbi:MAG: phosphopantetheine-binding protein [Prevotellaceae bacterium]|jgi:acyl carrier protein|nr:phosphopantetheine-binding protein [Prevotellaceae bacterium]